jgi:hypothetical protein
MTYDEAMTLLWHVPNLKEAREAIQAEHEQLRTQRKGLLWVCTMVAKCVADLALDELYEDMEFSRLLGIAITEATP